MDISGPRASGRMVVDTGAPAGGVAPTPHRGVLPPLVCPDPSKSTTVSSPPPIFSSGSHELCLKKAITGHTCSNACLLPTVHFITHAPHFLLHPVL